MSQAPATAPPTSFALFPKLPAELQLTIWEFVISAADEVPEVHLHLSLAPYYPTHLTEQWFVDTGWPVTAHVCRASRETLFKSGHLRLRHSSVAGFPVPFRTFNPAIDTLYVPRSRFMHMRCFLSRPANAPLARSLRHIAVEHDSASCPSSLPHGLICDLGTSLLTFSFVLLESLAGHPTSTGLSEPRRRC